MKRIFNILFGAVAVAGLSSCEDFLTREPINEFSAETYFSSETEMKMYANGMVNSWLPNPTDVDSGDAFNDLIATRTSTDFFRADVEWDNVKQGSWSSSNWAFTRRVAFMLEGMEKNGKGKVSDDVYNHYQGVARFWRAYHYFSKVKTFSDVPWIDKYLTPDDTTYLYAPREDREYIFHNMTEDLKFACENVKGDKDASGAASVNKWVVNALASRIYLYEASFRKYHPVNPATNQPWNNQYETSDDLFELAASTARTVMDEGGFSLAKDYSTLFLSDELDQNEVIWGRSYNDAVRHGYTKYFNSATQGQQYSGTKDLVRMFLKTDGTAVTTGETEITDEFEGRDPRLAVTILGPDHTFLSLSGVTETQYPDWSVVLTGYSIIKWVYPDETHFQNAVDQNSIPLVRYAEVLLNYAEAMEELGQMSVSIWNETVGALRERAGVKNIYPTTKDSFLYSYYTDDLAYPATNLSAVGLEIRRERATELCFEGGLRQSDIFRWSQADLVERRYNHQGWAGIWVSEAHKSGFEYVGKNYTFATSGAAKQKVYPITGTENTSWSLEKAGNGYYLVYNYKLKWEDRMYVRPIPQDATNINPDLGQNYGWE